MIIHNLDLSNFRNISEAKIEFSEGTNILFGKNAQGKTNVLEAIYLSSITKSHKGAKDNDLINFHENQAHIRTNILRIEDINFAPIGYRVDMHLHRNKAKGIAIDGKKIKKASEIVGLMNVVLFSPEDLSIIKDGPAVRRRFLNLELCQLDKNYLTDLNHYIKIMNSRNNVLKKVNENLLDTLDEQLVMYGSEIIKKRKKIIEELNHISTEIHSLLTGEKEKLTLEYVPNIDEKSFKNKLYKERDKDIRLKQTTVGPHRDDIAFKINGNDARKYMSQGQQRTCALSLKLSEIDLIKKTAGDYPILLLDDVLSELDAIRRQYLINYIGKIQTIITCTGLDEFIDSRFNMDRVFYVENGVVTGKN